MSISLFGPVGCGRPLRGVRYRNKRLHITHHRGFLAIHFIKVKWNLSDSCEGLTCVATGGAAVTVDAKVASVCTCLPTS
jgi:hypothetical protein